MICERWSSTVGANPKNQGESPRRGHQLRQRRRRLRVPEGPIRLTTGCLWPGARPRVSPTPPGSPGDRGGLSGDRSRGWKKTVYPGQAPGSHTLLPQARGPPSPTDAEAVKATLRGIRRTLGMAKVIKIVGLIGKKPQFLPHGLAAGRFKGVQQAMATRLHRLP